MNADIFSRLQTLAASEGEAPMTPVLLRVVVDLFVQRAHHSAAEIRQFEEMAGALIDASEPELLETVARELAPCADCPPSIVAALLRRGGGAAQAVLRTSMKLKWIELYDIAANGGADPACAVAQRRDLDERLVERLAERRECAVARALAANPNAPVGAKAASILIALGREDEVVARALLLRWPLEPSHLPLFLAADNGQRLTLIEWAVGDEAASNASAAPQHNAVDCLERCALAGERAALVETLAKATRCAPEIARRIVEDEGGEALVLSFVALGLDNEAIARILLATCPQIAGSVQKFQGLMLLARQTPHQAARVMIAAIAGDAQAFTDSPFSDF